MRLLLAFLLLTNFVYADDLAVCDPTSQPVTNAVTRFERTIDPAAFRGRAGFLIWTAPHELMSQEEQAKMNVLRSQFDALAQIPTRYWKCVDTNTDGLLDGVTEMTQAEQDAVDAPALAAQQRQQALSAEASTNPYCTESFEQVETRLAAISNAMPELREAVKQLARCVAVLREQGR